MEIIAISDTHNQHNEVNLSDVFSDTTDVLIHSGDFTNRGTKNEVINFLEWYEKINVPNKILIAGNHDFYFEHTKAAEILDLLGCYPSIKYLNDSGIIIDSVKFWGSPVQPFFYDWAFNRTEEQIKTHWDLIPSDTNVLITHGPVKGILDKTKHHKNVGCDNLREKVSQLTELKLFISGHIHEAYGIEKIENTTFVNASFLDINYKPKNSPIKIII